MAKGSKSNTTKGGSSRRSSTTTKGSGSNSRHNTTKGNSNHNRQANRGYSKGSDSLHENEGRYAKGGDSYYENDSQTGGYSKGRASYEDTYETDYYPKHSEGSTNDDYTYGKGGSSYPEDEGYDGSDSSKDYNDTYSEDYRYHDSYDNNKGYDDEYNAQGYGKNDTYSDTSDEEYYSSNVKDRGTHDDEPINDPPYDGYDEEVNVKRPQTDPLYESSKGGGNDDQEADMVFTEEEVYGDGFEDSEVDMVFTEEDVYGDGAVNDDTNESDRRERGDVFQRFVQRYGHLRFRNAGEINSFFADHSDQSDFISWFATHIGGRGAWRHRRFGRPSTENRSRFNLVWDRIPLLFSGREQNHSINIFQFFGLVSIMINEVGQTFTPIRERGSLRYMFETVIPASRTRPQRRKRSYNDHGSGPRNRNNKTAYELFNDEHFLAAHQNEPLYDRVANTTNRAWHGHVYPSGFPVRPSGGGIIAEADFYKFSGRGLVQTTWSRAYMRLIDATLSYSGRNAIILEYRDQWRRKQADGLSIRDIASQTKNIDWDRLFMETENEFACLAVFAFQRAKNNFLQIPDDARVLRRTDTGSGGSGSLFYVGYRVGGSQRYGNTVRDRVVQMMERILRDNQSS